MKIKFILLSFLVLFLNSCKTEEAEKDCDINNYGTFRVEFAASNINHSILVTFPDQSFRDKLVSTGTLSDTLNLFPGKYNVEVSSINSMGQSVDAKSFQINITECVETLERIDF
ncbi:MAG: hypothetical protein H6605_09365 [Flavobacteriales bacterium]|nr:hypothetical protein [Flavobacteriales bacterium]